MKKRKLTYRKAHAKKRGAIKAEMVDCFLVTLSKAILNYGHDKVLNMDETYIRLYNSSNQTITHKGAKQVYFYSNYVDEKAGTSYIATISLNPENRYPLIAIAKGNSPICEDKYGVQSDVITIHYESGWSHQKVVKEYLNILVEWCEPPLALVLDAYASHRSKEVKEHAKSLGIDLIYVPASGTGEYQPLDRKIFGILKGKLKHEEMIKPIEEINSKRTKLSMKEYPRFGKKKYQTKPSNQLGIFPD